MKKIACLLICFLLMLSSIPCVFTENNAPWEAEYTKVLQSTAKNSKTKAFLFDFTQDGTPDLILGDNARVSLFSYQDQSVIKLSEVTNIPIEYFVRLKKMQNNKTGKPVFFGQLPLENRLVTYRISFLDNTPNLKILATENDDGTGSFQGDGDASEVLADCSDRVAAYLSGYTLVPETTCTLSSAEILSAGSVSAAAQKLIARYQFLNHLSDDTASFSASDRNAMKEAVSEGRFAYFEKITTFSDSAFFVQFYETDPDNAFSVQLPATRQFAMVSKAGKKMIVTTKYSFESELDIEFLSSLSSLESFAANVSFDYGKTASFRGIDDYVNYLSSVLSSLSETPNANGKKAILEYIEFAVNKNSRAGIKARDNTIYVDDSSVAFIAEYATNCLDRLTNVCKANSISFNRKARALPEVICSGLDLSQPVRIEFEPGLAGTLSGTSGIRLMLDKNHGVTVFASDLATLDSQTDTFCIEFRHKPSAFSVVFTDKSNAPINYISAPVWFVVPAKNKFSTVMASFQGGTDNWGGQFDSANNRIEFSTNYSGDYEIVENDITINDIDDMHDDSKEVIRFMVSKGIFSLDKNNNFRPEGVLNRYDFTVALVKMFYALQKDAESSFRDVPKNSAFYRYIASAEMLGLTTGFADKTFRGKSPVSREQVFTLCGRTLAEKKGFAYPENYAQYLNFSDTSKISTWARGDIAIATQCGLLTNSGAFAPAGTVSRAEGAEILYKTFMLLYDVSPVTTAPSTQVDAQENNTLLSNVSMDLEFRIAICILLFVITLFGGYLLVKIKQYRDKKKQ